MTDDKSFSYTEAGFGLTLITCLLLGLGYAVIQRIGASSGPLQAPTTFSSTPPSAEPSPGVDSSQPAEHQASYAPQWLEPQAEQSTDTVVR